MKYILMMNGTKAGVDTYKAWDNKDIQTHFAYLHDLNKELSESGEFVATHPLAGPDEAKLVRAGNFGAPITDGVFPEAKEFLLGYWIVDVESPERAYEIAARLSAGPGPGGVPTNMPIEVRQIMSGRAKELDLEGSDQRRLEGRCKRDSGQRAYFHWIVVSPCAEPSTPVSAH
jgi:hypothetical protein